MARQLLSLCLISGDTACPVGVPTKFNFDHGRSGSAVGGVRLPPLPQAGEQRMKGNKRDRFYRPQLEALEDRDLLAASVLLQSGILNIRGTNQADTVVVSTSGSAVRVHLVNGTVLDRVFTASQVNRIFFRGFRGDDVFINDTAIPSTAFGDQ